MISILVIVIIILVISFIMALVISSNKDYNHTVKLTDDPSILFEEERNNTSNNVKIADEIEIEKPVENGNNKSTQEEVEDLFDDELI